MRDRPAVLMIAFHFPPCAVSSGSQRSLYFVRYLQERTPWQPIVLSASATSYERTSDDQLEDIPDDVRVLRPFAPDAIRHLSLRGRHLASMSRPDRWKLWKWTGLLPAMLVRRGHNVKAVWSTYPIATAHVLGRRLASMLSVPWIADVRDPMVEHVAASDTWYPTDEALRASRLAVEASMMKRAAFVTVCTDTSRTILRQRYSDTPPDKIVVVPNGFDERILNFVPKSAETRAVPSNAPLHIIHSGTLYGGETRDVSEFLNALRSVVASNKLTRPLRVTLRGTGDDDRYRRTIRTFGLESLVAVAPAVTHREALLEMMNADGLLLLQGRDSNSAIPAKTYEYIATGKPIFAVVGKGGDTARELEAYPLAETADVADSAELPRRLLAYLTALERRSHAGVSEKQILQFSRARGAAQLADLLSRVNVKPETA